MAHTLISAKYPPLIDPTRATIAYGDRALPRLNRELNSDHLRTRQRAVMALSDILHDPEFVNASIKIGIVGSLKKLLSDPDITVRQKSTECLFIIACCAVGRIALIRLEVIVPISKLFDDREMISRFNAHKVLEMVSENPLGALGIVDASLVPILVNNLLPEDDSIKLFILDSLHFCLMVNTEDALNANAMTIFKSLLPHPISNIRMKAARNIMNLSIPLRGKIEAVKQGVVSPLILLLSDDYAFVRAKAAGALSMIAITTEGKYAAFSAIDRLVDLVSDEISEVRLNSLKVLTSLSEAPEGRRTLLSYVKKIERLTFDPVPAVVKAAEIAVKVITWKP